MPCLAHASEPGVVNALNLSPYTGISRQRLSEKVHATIPTIIVGVALWPGGDSAYKRGGDARRKFWIKPLKETDLGVAQAFFDSQKRPF